jgi:predicted ATP-dependent Lon-type protease
VAHDKVWEFAYTLQVCVDAEAKKVLIPVSSVMDFQTLPPDLLIKVQPIFYSDPTAAVFKVWLHADKYRNDIIPGSGYEKLVTFFCIMN